MALHPYLDADGPVAFAHRGGAVEGVENTVTAFMAAYDLGFRYFETDVHLTTDNVVVAFHDAELDRVTNRTGNIGDLTWDQVHEAIVGGCERVPRLDELLRLFPDARFNVDAKTDAVLLPLLDLLVEYEALDRVCVASFSERRLRRARSLLGDSLCTSAGAAGLLAKMFNAYAFHVWRTGAKALQIPIRRKGVLITTRRLIESCHRDGVPVHVWTIDEAAVMHDLLDMGVDGIMTDRPAVLKAVFVERGLSLY